MSNYEQGRDFMEACLEFLEYEIGTKRVLDETAFIHTDDFRLGMIHVIYEFRKDRQTKGKNYWR